MQLSFFFSWKQGGMRDGDCLGGLVPPLEQLLMMIYWSPSITGAKDAIGIATAALVQLLIIHLRTKNW